MIKVSIIIPTLNHCEDLLKPCCESIVKYCNLEDKEVIVVANGCTDGTREYVESLGNPFKLLWYDKPLGFAKANNVALKEAKGKYVLLLNNDCWLLEQEKDNVINMLLEPLEKDEKVGIVGPKMLKCAPAGNRDFVIFFCVMIRKAVFDKIGLLDERFGVGSGEDIDFCIKAVDAGYSLAYAGERKHTGNPWSHDGMTSTLLVFHPGEKTVHDKTLVQNWEETYKRNLKILAERYGSKIKVSIVIGTLNHLEDCLKPCIDSIQKYCNLDDKEVIVVANGCGSDGTREYVESLGSPFKLLWYDKPLGYSKANNEGIKVAQGEYVLLLNNDAFLIEQKKDDLINMHLVHFERNPKMGIVGPIRAFSAPAGRDFIVFFCAMIKRSLFDELGFLDEVFGTGAGEDTDFCIRAVDAGYEMAIAGEMKGNIPGKGIITGSVPIFHKGESTVHDKTLIQNWDETFDKNSQILRDKYKRVPKKKVLCAIPTKGRYFTTLPLAIASVISQTVKPDALIIYDDGEHLDLRNNPLYGYLYRSLDDCGIKWSVTFTQGRGQHFAHQAANTSDYEYVWRLDDDNYAMPDVLEKLLSHMQDGVGAVAGVVVTPGAEAKSSEYGIKLIDVNRLPNIQWEKGTGVVETEHLYSSFLYRTNIVDYNLELSKVAHREETIFSHRMFRAGYKLLVDRSALTYHYRNPEGGIRTETDGKLWEHDEGLFHKELEKWGYKFIALSHGLGDHFAFCNIVPKLMKKCDKLVLFCVYPEVFQDYENVIVRPLGECGQFGCKEISTYEWMTRYNWKGSMVRAYEKIYLD